MTVVKPLCALLILTLTTAVGGCDLNREVLISGETMGTTYHIKVVTRLFQRTGGLDQKIKRRLEQINHSMSTYRPDSEISRFNTHVQRGEKVAVSTDFLRVLSAARKLHRLSGGAWDPTVRPLVHLWGFDGPSDQRTVPAEGRIAALLPQIGFGQIDIDQAGYLVKNGDQVSLDLASIAKGYGVDAVSALLKGEGFADFLVEIGGEIYASGRRRDGRYWRIGINQPRRDAAPDRVRRVVALENRALATSGDYRNYFRQKGRYYSHVLDPRSGYPVANGVVSVSVLAPSCTLADGLATALMVMGAKHGLALVDRLDLVEVLVVVQNPDGTLTDFSSNGFRTDEGMGQ